MIILQEEYVGPIKTFTETQKRSKQGGIFPCEYMRRLKTLTPHAAARFHRVVVESIRDVIKENRSSTSEAFGVRPDTTEQDRFTNLHRELTIAFNYPRNGTYYISIPNDTSRCYIFRWIGAGHAFYFLHYASLRLSIFLIRCRKRNAIK